MTSPVEGGQAGSRREETVAVKRKSEAELEVTSGERTEEGSSMPTLGRRVEAQLWCLPAASSSYNSCAHLTSVSAPVLLPGWPPSPPRSLLLPCQLLFLASSSFLPTVWQKAAGEAAALPGNLPAPGGWSCPESWVRAQALETGQVLFPAPALKSWVTSASS